MLGWEKMIRRIVRVWIQLFFYRAHRSSTSNSTSSSSDSYTSTHFIAMREPQRRFQAFFVGKVKYFFTKTFFFVDSLAPYVHFHKENGFPFTRKPWVGTGFLGVSNSSTYSKIIKFQGLPAVFHGRSEGVYGYIGACTTQENFVRKKSPIFGLLFCRCPSSSSGLFSFGK